MDYFPTLDVEEARKIYTLSKDSRDWKVSLAQKDIKIAKGQVCRILYRPFDIRYTFYTGKSRGFICMPRPDVMRHMLYGSNVALVFPRQTINNQGPPVSVIVADTIVEGCSVYTSKGIAQVTPLYILPDEYIENTLQQRSVNIKPEILEEITALAQHPELGKPNELQILDYVYGALQCPAYQKAYGIFLKEDFPRIPKPSSPTEFWDVSNKGGQLRSLHLFKDLDLNHLPNSFYGDGNNIVDKFSYLNGRIMINKTQGFESVPKHVWDCYVGGFQAARTWLKSRKGRKLEPEEINHFQRILKVLDKTVQIRDTIKIDI